MEMDLIIQLFLNIHPPISVLQHMQQYRVRFFIDVKKIYKFFENQTNLIFHLFQFRVPNMRANFLSGDDWWRKFLSWSDHSGPASLCSSERNFFIFYWFYNLIC